MRKYFRDRMGNVQPMLDIVEGISFQSSPLDLFILLARYKFAARLIDRNDNVLDAGCGHGLGSVMLAKFCRSVTAVDIDPELIEDCRSKYAGVKNLHFETADLKRLSLLSRKYDAIVCMDVIEHFSQEEGREIIKEFSGLLDERGCWSSVRRMSNQRNLYRIAGSRPTNSNMIMKPSEIYSREPSDGQWCFLTRTRL